MIKGHLRGGSIEAFIVNRVKTLFAELHDDGQKLTKISLDLGISPKTLRQWLGPIEKGGWEAFQGQNLMEVFMAKVSKPVKKSSTKKPAPKKAASPKKKSITAKTASV